MLQRSAASGRAQDPAWSWAPSPQDEAERRADDQRAEALLRVCTAPGCTASLLRKNAHARFCSDACRKRSRRASPVQPSEATEAAMGAAGASARPAAGAGGAPAAGVGLPSSVSALAEASAWLGPSLLADGEEMHLLENGEGEPVDDMADAKMEVSVEDAQGEEEATRAGRAGAGAAWADRSGVGALASTQAAGSEGGAVLRGTLAEARGGQPGPPSAEARRIDELFDRVGWLELSLAEGYGSADAEALRSLRAELAALRVDLERGLAGADSVAAAAMKTASATSIAASELAQVKARVAAVEGSSKESQTSAAAALKALKVAVEGLKADLKGLGARVDAGTARDREVQAAVKELKGQMADVVRSLSALAELV